MTNNTFHDKLQSFNRGPLTSRGISVLQVNMGYRCNMACAHCHVSAGPGRSEVMEGKTVESILRVLRENPIATLDITGGAPELNPHFRALVAGARKAGKRVISRTNLTIFFEKGMDGLPEFYREQGVELVASLPCYLEENVNRVRGDGAYHKSIDALRMLNRLGYGDESSALRLSLVYNPGGAFLAPPQGALEADYKRVLKERHGIVFTRLFAFANMPVGRFRDSLARSGTLDAYLDMLASAFNPATLDTIMCRSLLSVGWDGALYDCDFNQILGIAVSSDAPRHIRDFDFAALSGRRISMDDHCFGCTAGQGST